MIAFQLYLILDRELLGKRSLAGVAEELVAGGAEIIQYRDKLSTPAEIKVNCRLLKRITDAAGIPLIINDYPQIALELGAAGVHLGQEDIAPLKARALLGENRIIGLSTHSLVQVQAVSPVELDYIGIGPVFKTSTKMNSQPIGVEVVSRVVEQTKVPAVAIGGINLANIDQVLAAGIKRIAVASAVLQRADIKNTVKLFLEKLRS